MCLDETDEASSLGSGYNWRNCTAPRKHWLYHKIMAAVVLISKPQEKGHMNWCTRILLIVF